jgi:hypothetical protein
VGTKDDAGTDPAAGLLTALSVLYRGGLGAAVRLERLGFSTSLSVALPVYQNHPHPWFEMYLEVRDHEDHLACVGVETSLAGDGWFWECRVEIYQPDPTTVWNLESTGLSLDTLVGDLTGVADRLRGEWLDSEFLPLWRAYVAGAS